MPSSRAMACVGAIAWSIPSLATAATLSAPGIGGTIQEVIDVALPGDEVEISAGTYDEALVISYDLVLRGVNGPELAPTGSPLAAIAIAAGATVEIEGLEITATGSRGIHAAAGTDVRLSSVTVVLGNADFGGAVYSEGDFLSAEGFASFASNASADGGAVYTTASFTCTDCTFSNPVATLDGGAIYAAGPSLTLVDVTIDRGSAGGRGASVYAEGSAVEIVRTLSCSAASNAVSAVHFESCDGRLEASAFSNGEVTIDGGSWVIDHLLSEASSVGVVFGPSAATASLSNTLFVGHDVGVEQGSATLTSSFNAFAGVSTPVAGGSAAASSLILGAPTDQLAFRCTPLSTAPAFDYPTIDAGSGLDPDGSAADIGASGGPSTWSFLHEDQDGDGFSVVQECDDGEPLSTPGGVERCDGVDNNCDGTVDTDAIDLQLWFPDVDRDGYGAGTSPAGSQVVACEAPPDLPDGTPFGVGGADCDDTDPAIHPSAAELCDSVDRNCDGSSSFGASNAVDWVLDADGDGHGDSTQPVQVACSAPGPSHIPGVANDCNDADNSIHPSAAERCDGVDNNCSGNELDAMDRVQAMPDNDGDGFPRSTGGGLYCVIPTGFVEAGGVIDCDDSNASAFPGGVEVCDGVDNDCSGIADDLTEAPPLWFADDDSDGFGTMQAEASVLTDCPAPGYVSSSTDCDDSDHSVFPGAEESCDGRDNDCSGVADDGPPKNYYVDRDGDGYGGDVQSASCPPEGSVETGGDCQDFLPDIHPGADEIPGNDIDEDCSGDARGAAALERGQPPESGCQCSQTSGRTTTGLGIGGLLFLSLSRRRSRWNVKSGGTP